MNDHLFVISSSPHVNAEDTIPTIMYGVVLALAPAMLGAAVFFGITAILLILTCVTACLLTEYVFQRARNKAVTVGDGSAIITGILLALVLPPDFSLLSAVLGAVAAMALGKHVFGGLGHNIFNPALVGRAFLQATYPIDMTTWTEPLSRSFWALGAAAPDAVTAATPLAAMKFSGESVEWWKMLIGYTGGCLGETSALLILLGGAYLVYKRYLDWRIPAGFLGTVAVLGGIFWRVNPSAYPHPGFHLLAGGLMLGAVFMATDMVTSPVTPLGVWIFGIGAGTLVIIIRLFGGLPEGVMFSILIMNSVTPLLNRYTRPKVFGSENLVKREK
jgi:Na+-translocating ferredoxin:NAD+ oxidoreductase subunit D